MKPVVYPGGGSCPDNASNRAERVIKGYKQNKECVLISLYLQRKPAQLAAGCLEVGLAMHQKEWCSADEKLRDYKQEDVASKSYLLILNTNAKLVTLPRRYMILF